MLLSASNLWFPASLSIVVMPEATSETHATMAADLLNAAGVKRLEKYGSNLAKWREYLDDEDSPLAELSDDHLAAAIAQLMEPPPSEEELAEQRRNFDPISLLVPEWNFLLRDPSASCTRQMRKAVWSCRPHCGRSACRSNCQAR
ncbi:hypothetical protein [Arthrobacter dokdonensis]|uniref:hypothetical protein n=1 Tax=Arthrobacter dokdonellae TaxID=2211210 RepID=UPI001D1318E4|nr:hypothetical protein [Arthrobacter dokdonellae]